MAQNHHLHKVFQRKISAPQVVAELPTIEVLPEDGMLGERFTLPILLDALGRNLTPEFLCMNLLSNFVPADATILINALSQNTSTKRISIIFNNQICDDATTDAVIHLIKHKETLAGLMLTDCSFSVKNKARILQALVDNRTVKTLILQNHEPLPIEINPEDENNLADSIARLLRENSTLKDLEVSTDEVGSKMSLLPVWEALAFSQLETFDIVGYNITLSDIPFLLRSLQEKLHLQYLAFRGDWLNECSQELYEAFLKILQCSSLPNLCLEFTAVGFPEARIREIMHKCPIVNTLEILHQFPDEEIEDRFFKDFTEYVIRLGRPFKLILNGDVVCELTKADIESSVCEGAGPVLFPCPGVSLFDTGSAADQVNRKRPPDEEDDQPPKRHADPAFK